MKYKVCMIRIILSISFVIAMVFSFNIKSEDNSQDYNNEISAEESKEQEEAKVFVQKIQEIFKAQDLDGLLDLIDGELKYGPRKKTMGAKKFNEIFDQEIINEVLNQDLSDIFHNYEGYAIASSAIWFDKPFDNWRIFTINTKVKDPVDSTLPIGWNVGDKIMGIGCFNFEWLSGDNFKAFWNALNIENEYTDKSFSNNPGLYIKDNSPLLNAIEAYDMQLIFAPQLDQCLVNKDRVLIEDREIIQEANDDGEKVRYKILSKVPTSMCKKLAPLLSAPCKESYVIQSTECYNGASLGCYSSVYIYGLFELKDGRNIVMPLKRFESENQGLSYIDEYIEKNADIKNDK